MYIIICRGTIRAKFKTKKEALKEFNENGRDCCILYKIKLLKTK